MELGCYIVDDEIHAIKVLSRYIDKTPGLFLVGSDTDPLKAWSSIDNKSVNPDIAFLDIDMPQLSGTELADLIRHRTEIVFTTAHPDYAIRAFESDALDYLLKPVTYERFLKTISKAKDKLFKKQIDQSINLEEDFYIKSEAKGKMIKVKYNDIYYIEAKANYLKIYLDKESYMTYLTMKELEEKLPPKKFIRVHKSFIINIQKIMALETNQILLENKNTVVIGRSYRSSLLSVINPRLIRSKRMP